MSDRAGSDVTRAAWVRSMVQACVGHGRYRPSDLLSWLVDKILQGFGLPTDAPPDDVVGWLREQHLAYARAVSQHPLEDLLGNVYEELASRGHRGALGQFFSPSSIGELMSSILGGMEAAHAKMQQRSDRDDLVRICEPACGSGALLLSFMRSAVAAGGRSALESYSFTAIDLDRLCARICAAQILVNMHIHDHSVGELVVYHGDALDDPASLKVVIHASIRSLGPDLVLPALHPSRVAALRDASASQQLDESRKPMKTVGASRRDARGRMVEADDEPDLFSTERG